MIKDFLIKIENGLNFTYKEIQKNVFSLQVSDRIEIKIEVIEKDFILHSNVSILGNEKKEELFSYLMMANFLGYGTGRGKIGLDNETKMITLSKRINKNVKYEEFYEILEEFINYVAYWQKEIIKFIEKQKENIFS